ncbi:MAG: hypothetical protein AAF438_09030, partial [Pseudomonadota bacterium]
MPLKPVWTAKHLCITLSVAWVVVLTPTLFAQDEIDPIDIVIRTNDLAAKLDDPNLTERQAELYRGQAAALVIESKACVDDRQELIAQARAEKAALGITELEDGQSDDLDELTIRDPETLVQLETIEVRENLAVKELGDCRLANLRADRLSALANELQRNLSAERLTSRGEAGLNIFKNLPTKIRLWYGRLKEQAQEGGQINRLQGWTLVGVFALMIPAVFIGRWTRSWVRGWSDVQRGTRGEASVSAALAKTAVSSLPTILGGLTLSVAVALLIGNTSIQLMIIRFALAILLFGLGRTFITWITGPGSPGHG